MNAPISPKAPETTLPQAVTLLCDHAAFHSPHGSECASRIPYNPPRGFHRRECDCGLRHAKENAQIVRDGFAALQSSYDSLARKLEQSREALTTLDARLRECMNDPIAVSEAYDSFYQDMVSAALKPSNEVGT